MARDDYDKMAHRLIADHPDGKATFWLHDMLAHHINDVCLGNLVRGSAEPTDLNVIWFNPAGGDSLAERKAAQGVYKINPTGVAGSGNWIENPSTTQYEAWLKRRLGVTSGGGGYTPPPAYGAIGDVITTSHSANYMMTFVISQIYPASQVMGGQYQGLPINGSYPHPYKAHFGLVGSWRLQGVGEEMDGGNVVRDTATWVRVA